jgi:hypothetical protein
MSGWLLATTGWPSDRQSSAYAVFDPFVGTGALLLGAELLLLYGP